jgi:large subunit ribosomal protein L23
MEIKETAKTNVAMFVDHEKKVIDSFIEIKNEVESLYNVTVIDVNTIRYAGKRSSRYTRAGLVKGQKNAFKQAIVTLKEGDTIDFYSNIQ